MNENKYCDQQMIISIAQKHFISSCFQLLSATRVLYSQDIWYCTLFRWNLWVKILNRTHSFHGYKMSLFSFLCIETYQSNKTVTEVGLGHWTHNFFYFNKNDFSTKSFNLINIIMLKIDAVLVIVVLKNLFAKYNNICWTNFWRQNLSE